MTATPPEIEPARERVRRAYDPELLRSTGQRLIALLADHLQAAENSEGVVLPPHEPLDNIRLAASMMRECRETEADAAADLPLLAEQFSRIVQIMVDRGHNLHDPRYIGHQVAAPVPIAGLFDAVGAITNQAMAIYDMGPWATAAEWAMVEELGRAIGWQPGQFSGLATHGGSLANLTALLTARNVSLPNSWQDGPVDKGKPPVLLVHADAHYSVARTAGILGLGTRQVVRVGLDARRRMDPQKLDDAIRELRSRNQPIVAVSACACSTPIGAFDPLIDVAEVCRRHGVWLHVDAAHGGAACLSAVHHPLVAGLDQADSLIWDAHKMLFVPALCAFVFYRDAGHRFETFHQDAPYLFDPSAPGLAEYDSGLRTIECTKRAAAFGLWGCWTLFGRQLFADMVDITFSMGRLFYEKLQAAADFAPLHEPQCNIVAFRHLPDALRGAAADAVSRFQLELRRRLIASGRFFIVSTQLDGVGALRVTVINPLTTPDHLDELLAAIRETGAEMLREAGHGKS